MASELTLLQAARLKGRLSPDLAASSCDADLDTTTTLLSALREAGYLKGEQALRLTPEGRARLEKLLARERTEIDREILQQLYAEFHEHNSDLKAVISDWQLKDGGPNDHTDVQYDQAVLERLGALDAGFRPLLARVANAVPRLDSYRRRLNAALERINAGDSSYVARPIVDSYHTVWFELHEELIVLLGLNREHEAAAGRAV